MPPMLPVHCTDNAGVVTVHLEGTFDARAAAELRALLDQHRGETVVIDFSRVRQFMDLAVPILTRGLEHPGLRFRGLGQHHERVFRYFGISASGPSLRREFGFPEEAAM